MVNISLICCKKTIVFLAHHFEKVRFFNTFYERNKTMKYIKLALLSLAFIAILANSSFAAGSSDGYSLMETAAGKAVRIFNHVKMIIFVVGGFGLVGIAFQAIFGKVKWTWFAGLAVGLAILAAAGAIVNYATGATMGEGSSAGEVSDSFGKDDEGAFGGRS
ncbi:MAG: TrbC/VirB2 family protein [Acetobacter sp.]|nr:TrbC/VirB2 family protein [Acetobacter sp.]